jgi:ElaB/YqjD/DUF883 family membrane-anchored ribosome-binding protein
MFKSSPAEQVAHQIDGVIDPALSTAGQAVDSVGRVMEQGMERVRETSHQLRDSAARVSEGTVNYIRHDPVKSVLMAAATGAALMALLSLLTRPSNRP